MVVRIKDVAAAAQVSPATVSRVLAGRAVDEAMRARVLAAVEATGYRPNLAARRLRSRHTNTIGLIVADIRNPFFTAVSRAVEHLAYARGLRVILANTDEDPEKEAMYLQLMQEERVTGVILAATRAGLDQLARQPFDFPTVLIDRTAPHVMADQVVLDNGAMAGLLVDHLAASGHRRIAGLFGAASATGLERQLGYEAAMARAGLAAQAVPVPHGAGATERIVSALLTAPQPPEALIASNGVMLTAALRAVRALGAAAPPGLAMAGFDNEPWMDCLSTGLAVIEQPVEEIGRSAMAMLMDRLEHAEAPVRKVVLRGQLVLREAGQGTPG